MSEEVNLSIDERLKLVHEIFLVIGHNKRITEAQGPQVDSFWLVRAILFNEKYRCNTRNRIIGVLRKSPIWDRVKIFLNNNDTSCARKGCRRGEYAHPTTFCPTFIPRVF